MKFIFKLLLTINATFWMIVIYAIKESWTIGTLSPCLFSFGLLLIPIFLSALSIFLSKYLSKDSLSECQEFNLADNEFLPVYLGYFFLSVSVSDQKTMIFLYLMVFIFTFLSQTQYFNPIFLLFGYHYYHILTPYGTRVFVIARGKVIRNIRNCTFDNLRRINDTTYIEKED